MRLGRQPNPRERSAEEGEKILDVDASMQGTLTFKDPVNLRINGTFEGTLNTKGNLTIGETAQVKATITGETVVIAGEVVGDIVASIELRLMAPARLVGDVETPSLVVQKGATLQGRLNMINAQGVREDRPHTPGDRGTMGVDELASYLAVEKTLIFEWAESGKLPAVRDGKNWRFEKNKVDEWVASGKIK